MIIASPVSRRRPRIEIIPLIDIIFFLLATFVMVSLAMVKNQGINVNLPTASTSSAQDPRHVITITINDKQEIYMNHDLVSLAQMSARLEELKSSDPDLKVLINGDEKASFGRAINILDEVRQIGISKISIRTKSPTSGNK